MVSFQCDACTDVVKKPKLDRHHGQCRSSFTCIDCSATFAGPAQWKGHTSCVTEAEKYQKSLYKGPKRGSGPGNEYQRNSNSQAKPMNAPGKYHQLHPTQSGWSRPQYTRNCASGANSTPLGSPRRMSPADPLPAEPSPSDANTATKTERGESKKRGSAAVLESHTSNGTEPKEKKRKKKHDPPRTQNGKEATADETTDVAPEPLPKSPSKVQVPDDGILEQSGEKKLKKNRKEKREDAQQETVPHVDDSTKDEKKAKKRKHKEKREKDAQADQDSAAKEGATELEAVALQTDDTKGKKKKKGKEEKAGVEVAVATDQATSENRKHEDLVVNGGEEKRKRKRKKTTEEGS